jgi:hypothetical protein
MCDRSAFNDKYYKWKHNCYRIYDVHGAVVLSAFYEHNSSGHHPIRTEEVRSSVFSVDPRRLW